MSNYRTSSLFHYTTLNSLKRILKEGINPNFCIENLSTLSNDYFIGIPMVSFCDIPLTRTYEFTSRYGKHAIGLSKEWAIKNNINPILYVSNEIIMSSLHFYKAYEHSQKMELEKRGSDGKGIKINLFDPQSLSGIAPLVNHGNSHNANLNLLGYTKKYESKNPKTKLAQCNYEENEWRYIVKEDSSKKIDWLWSLDTYKTWRGEGKVKPDPSNELVKNKLTFDVNDITHIIVEKEEQILSVVKTIENTSTIGGIVNSISDDSKKLLFSKIISMEKIEKDF